MKLFQIVVERDDTVRVVDVDVVKETPQYYFIKPERGLAWNDPVRLARAAFGYSDRIPKDSAFVSARAALEHYMQRRQTAKSQAQSIIGQASKQIASANELLMKLPPEEHVSADAVVPVAERVTE